MALNTAKKVYTVYARLQSCLQVASFNLCQRCIRSYSEADSISPRYLDSNFEAHNETLFQKPVQPLDPKRLRVGVIGIPNAGKSTLINRLMGTSLLATSKRIDTTQKNALGILTHGNIQIEFEDTPGMHSKQKSKRVSGSFERAYYPGACMEEADLCIVIADLSERSTSSGYLSPIVLLHLLKYRQTPSILVLNKVDKLSDKTNVLPITEFLTAGMIDGVPFVDKSRSKALQPISLPEIQTEVFQSLDVIKTLDTATEIDFVNKSEAKILKRLRHCRGWPYFKDVFVISALKKKRIEELKQYLMMKALSKPWRYHSKVLTDASPYDIAKDAVRSTLLENLAEELPYTTDIHISNWNETENFIEISVILVCRKIRCEPYIERASKVLSFGIKRRLKHIFSKEVEILISVYNHDSYSHFMGK